MIPKIIHYCWFGGNPKPPLAEKCIESWKKYCPDYEMREWNENNFDISSAPLYVRQAYEAKKWAFITDYVRLWAMVNFGGIYMDTDVEVLKPLDRFLEHNAFSGFEISGLIPTGIMGSEKEFPLFKELLQEYDTLTFIKSNGEFDLTTNVIRITERCRKHGFIQNGEYQVINGFALYPKDYFCPREGCEKKANITENTFTDHHFSASWADKKTKQKWKKDGRNNKRQVRKYKRFVFMKKIAICLFGNNYGKIKNIIIKKHR